MKVYCESCKKSTEKNVELLTQEFVVKDKKIIATIKVCICLSCGEEIWDEELEKENEKILFAEYRRQAGLLQPEEIKAIREKYKISQATFSKILGFGEKTITRYENGSIQDYCHDNLIVLMNNPNIFYEIWELRKSLLSVRENKRIEQMLDKILAVKTEGTYSLRSRYVEYGEWIEYDFGQGVGGNRNAA